MNRVIIVLVVLCSAILLPWIYRYVNFLDFGESVFSHTPGPCRVVEGANTGSEDMELIPGTSVAVISSGLRSDKALFPGRKGNILFYDFKDAEKGAVPAIFQGFEADENFNPHGISVWSNGEKVELLVVNHLDESDVVERFHVDKNKRTLTHIESIQTGVVNMNDLSATGERSFYFTQSTKYKFDTVMGMIESMALLRLSALYHFNGVNSNMLDDGHFILNGITQSTDKKYLYVASSGDLQILVYQIQPNNLLHLVQQKDIDTLADNVNVDPSNGDLWLGCHPVRWKALYHLQTQETTRSPSQVIRVQTNQGLLTENIKEVYVDDGETITASTVALVYNSNLLIGSLNNKIVHCKIKYI